LLNYDSRDNIFTPSNGLASEIKVMLFVDAWGSDDTFQKYLASFMYYNPLTDNLVLGLRGDAKTIDGAAPFYAYPFVDMRGIKAMQYQGETTMLGEFELRWSFTSRWALVGFGGAGKAFNEDDREDSEVIYSKGLGIRYLIASKLGLQTGIDVAQGPDDTAIYLQFGGSWAIK
jgi:outer membrane translocation and assembly module TamA